LSLLSFRLVVTLLWIAVVDFPRTNMATTLQEFSDKLDRLDGEFGKKMEEQNKKFFADKPDESTLSPEMKEHYEKFEKMIKEHTDKFNKKMREHSEHFKGKFAELLEQQKNAQFPGK
jgi:GTPase involved in cell partitioning and DNA repair